MGEFTGNGDQHVTNANDDINQKAGTGIETEEGYPTDVESINSDDVVKKGTERYPAFNVTPHEFFQNQVSSRKRVRFKNGSKVSDYMKKTKNSARPFFIKTTTNDGKSYTRRIK